MKSRPIPLALIELIVFIIVAVALGIRPLTDPDIGWHVASGLWMLDHATVPYPDPFASGGGTWIAYSWLAEIIYAFVFRLHGFRGLQILQLASILLSLGSLVFLVDSASLKVARQGVGGRSLALARALTYLLLIPTLTLVWHLRPQVFSLVCFALFLGWRERGEERLRFLVPLAILWLNVHVYWIFMPLILAVELVFSRAELKRGWAESVTRLMLLFACVLTNPYGVEHLRVIYQYAFQHSAAYQLIAEFQPIYKQGWLIPTLFAFWLLLALPSMLKDVRSGKWSELCLYVLFAGAALMQLKYLPMFALFVTPWVVNSLAFAFETLAKRNNSITVQPIRLDGPLSGIQMVSLLLGGGTLVSLVLGFRQPQEILPPRQQHVMQLVEQIIKREEPKRSRCVILSDFNDSGWVILSSYLARHATTEQLAAECRVAIDGRTLVTGGVRMTEYAQLQRSEADLVDILKRWQVSDLLLDADARIAKWSIDAGAQSKERYENLEWLVLPH